MLPLPFRRVLRSLNSELTGDVGLLVVETSVTISERGGEKAKCEFDRLRECLLDYEWRDGLISRNSIHTKAKTHLVSWIRNEMWGLGGCHYDARIVLGNGL